MDVGFVGLGSMGRPMVRRLLLAGHTVHVFGRSADVVNMLVHAGAIAASSIGIVAQRADQVHTALPDPEAVDAVYDELLTTARPGQVFIEHSTIAPDHSRRWSVDLTARGSAYLDAPISGGPEGAAHGTLAVMVGGDVATFDAALPVLRSLGSVVERCGPVGSGQVVKLVNQLLVGVHAAASAEAAAFATRMGADLGPALTLVGHGYGASTILARNGPRFIGRDFSPASPIRLFVKDLALIRAEASQRGIPVPLAIAAEARFVEADDRGYGNSDMAGLLQLWDDD